MRARTNKYVTKHETITPYIDKVLTPLRKSEKMNRDFFKKDLKMKNVYLTHRARKRMWENHPSSNKIKQIEINIRLIEFRIPKQLQRRRFWVRDSNRVFQYEFQLNSQSIAFFQLRKKNFNQIKTKRRREEKVSFFRFRFPQLRREIVAKAKSLDGQLSSI